MFIEVVIEVDDGNCPIGTQACEVGNDVEAYEVSRSPHVIADQLGSREQCLDTSTELGEYTSIHHLSVPVYQLTGLKRRVEGAFRATTGGPPFVKRREQSKCDQYCTKGRRGLLGTSFILPLADSDRLSCSALPGVALGRVSCVRGVREVMACQEGWSPVNGSCHIIWQ